MPTIERVPFTQVAIYPVFPLGIGAKPPVGLAIAQDVSTQTHRVDQTAMIDVQPVEVRVGGYGLALPGGSAIFGEKHRAFKPNDPAGLVIHHFDLLQTRDLWVQQERAPSLLVMKRVRIKEHRPGNTGTILMLLCATREPNIVQFPIPIVIQRICSGIVERTETIEEIA